MSPNTTSYFFVLLSLVLTLYGQIIIKHRINLLPNITGDFLTKSKMVVKFFYDPYILSGLFAALIASFFWMMALTNLSITRAYPIMAAAPVLILIFGVLTLNEELTAGKLIGAVLIFFGIILSAKC